MDEIQYAGLLLLDYVALLFYARRACRYSETVLKMQKLGSKVLLPAAAMGLMWMAAFSGLPILVIYLFLYSAILLYFLLSRGNSLPVALFASGTFMFHIADLHMMLFGVFAVLCDIRSMEAFRGTSLYLFLILLVILASMACLEIFDRIFDQDTIRILVNNNRQLRFAATSLMFIDIYLLILSSVYDSGMYTSLILLFLVITSILLLGAFYTSFLHAVRMSILELYESRFKDLESQLEQSNRNIGKLKDEAYTDVLTGVGSRRFGLLGLDRMVREGKNVSISLVDLDGLKAVNDNQGHQEGDRYLVGVAHVLAECFGVRYVCRLGGDEFLVIMPDTTEEEAERRMEEACRGMENAFDGQGIALRPSVSYGVAESGRLPFGTGTDLLKLADRRMYEMKRKRHETGRPKD